MPLLTIATFLPILAGLALMALPDRSTKTAHTVSIAATGAVFLVTLAIWARGTTAGEFAQVEEIAWIPAIGAAYRLGVDGLSLPLVLLTSLLFFLSAIYSARIGERAASYVVLMLMLETASLGTFMALDGLLFYVFFEVSLVGMYFMIAGWGYEERQRAALMFFLYTLLGSLPLLLAIIGLYLGSGTFDMRVWVEGTALGGLPAMLALIAMLVTFAVKIPAFPVHTWLPAAHVQAPTAGSVILAGVMLKFGTYGLVRFAYQMTPEAFAQAGQVILAFGVVSALYGAFAALAQSDLKKMIAYTSVNHMGYVVMGVAIATLAAEPRIRSATVWSRARSSSLSVCCRTGRIRAGSAISAGCLGACRGSAGRSSCLPSRRWDCRGWHTSRPNSRYSSPHSTACPGALPRSLPSWSRRRFTCGPSPASSWAR